MSTDKHTPGPWTQLVSIGDWSLDETYREILAGNGYFDKDAPNAGFHLTGYITEANAALIASAPFLKEENERLKEQVEELTPSHPQLVQDVWDRDMRSLKDENARLQSENELLQRDLNLVIVDEFRKEHIELRQKYKLLREEVESCILELQENEDEISAASVKSRLERALAK